MAWEQQQVVWHAPSQLFPETLRLYPLLASLEYRRPLYPQHGYREHTCTMVASTALSINNEHIIYVSTFPFFVIKARGYEKG